MMDFALPCFVLLGLVPCAFAGEGARIFTEDWVSKFPLKTFVMLIFVIATVYALEKLFHALRHLPNRHAAHIVNLALNELNTLGVLSLGLFIIQTIFSLQAETILLFEWAHIILFLMSISFLFFMGVFIWATTTFWRQWRAAEVEVADLVSIAFAMRRSTRRGLAERYMHRWMRLVLEKRLLGRAKRTDYLAALPPVPGVCNVSIPPSHSFNPSEDGESGSRGAKLDPARLAHLRERLIATLRSRAPREFFLTYAKFRMDIAAVMPESVRSLTFVRYLAKCQRAVFTRVFEISLAAWVSILTLGLLNSVRSVVVAGVVGQGRSDKWWDLLTFALVVGYVPLVPYLCLSFFVWGSYKKMSNVGLASVRAHAYAAEKLGAYSAHRRASAATTAPSAALSLLSASGDYMALLSLVEQLVESASEQPRIAWLKRRLHLESAPERSMRKLVDSCTFDNKYYFVWESENLTFTILQIQLLLSVFYFSNLLVSLVAQMAISTPWYVNAFVVPISILPIVIFVATVPKSVQLLTVLSSTGTMLREDILTEMVSKDRAKAQKASKDSDSSDDDIAADVQSAASDDSRESRVVSKGDIMFSSVVGGVLRPPSGGTDGAKPGDGGRVVMPALRALPTDVTSSRDEVEDEGVNSASVGGMGKARGTLGDDAGALGGTVGDSANAFHAQHAAPPPLSRAALARAADGVSFPYVPPSSSLVQRFNPLHGAPTAISPGGRRGSDGGDSAGGRRAVGFDGSGNGRSGDYGQSAYGVGLKPPAVPKDPLLKSGSSDGSDGASPRGVGARDSGDGAKGRGRAQSQGPSASATPPNPRAVPSASDLIETSPTVGDRALSELPLSMAFPAALSQRSFFDPSLDPPVQQPRPPREATPPKALPLAGLRGGVDSTSSPAAALMNAAAGSPLLRRAALHDLADDSPSNLSQGRWLVDSQSPSLARTTGRSSPPPPPPDSRGARKARVSRSGRGARKSEVVDDDADAEFSPRGASRALGEKNRSSKSPPSRKRGAVHDDDSDAEGSEGASPGASSSPLSRMRSLFGRKGGSGGH